MVYLWCSYDRMIPSSNELHPALLCLAFGTHCWHISWILTATISLLNYWSHMLLVKVDIGRSSCDSRGIKPCSHETVATKIEHWSWSPCLMRTTEFTSLQMQWIQLNNHGICDKKRGEKERYIPYHDSHEKEMARGPYEKIQSIGQMNWTMCCRYERLILEDIILLYL